MHDEAFQGFFKLAIGHHVLYSITSLINLVVRLAPRLGATESRHMSVPVEARV